MATKKPTKKASSAKSAPKKTTSKAATAKTTKVTKPASAQTVKTSVVTKKKKSGLDTSLPSNLINIVIAEVFGTFVLTLVAVLATAYALLPLYVGLTLTVLVFAIGLVSGSHINPAVTFGLWAAKKVKTVLVPFYWAAQFLGAMAAIVLIGAMSNGSFNVHFDHFTDFSVPLFALELVGTAVFMFGLTAAVAKTDLKMTGKALAIGMSLMVGLLVTGSLLPYVQNTAIAQYQEEQAAKEESDEKSTSANEQSYPKEVYVGGATLNPAVAMAVTEKTDSQLQGAQVPQKDEKPYTRLSVEVILGTLVGAAIGSNLLLLVNYRSKEQA